MGFQYYPNLDVINNTYEKEKIGFYFSLSPQISYLYEKKHNLELGISGLYFYNKRVDVTVSVFSRYIITCIGYRYQKPDGGAGTHFHAGTCIDRKCCRVGIGADQSAASAAWE